MGLYDNLYDKERQRFAELVDPLLNDDLFFHEPLTAEHAAIVHTLLGRIKKAVKDRRKELRDVLLEYAEELGEEKGQSRVVQLGEHVTVKRTSYRSARIDEKGLRMLLDENNLDLYEAFDRIEQAIPNPSKIEALISLGKLSRDDVDALYSERVRLRVTDDTE